MNRWCLWCMAWVKSADGFCPKCGQTAFGASPDMDPNLPPVTEPVLEEPAPDEIDRIIEDKT